MTRDNIQHVTSDQPETGDLPIDGKKPIQTKSSLKNRKVSVVTENDDELQTWNEAKTKPTEHNLPSRWPHIRKIWIRRIFNIICFSLSLVFSVAQYVSLNCVS